MWQSRIESNYPNELVLQRTLDRLILGRDHVGDLIDGHLHCYRVSGILGGE